MKANGVLQIVLTIAVIVLFILHFTSKSSPAAANSPEGDKTGVKIYYINEDSLLTKYEYFNTKRLEIEDAKYTVEVDLQAKVQKLQQEITAFQKKAQSGAYSPKELQTMQEGLEKKQNQLMVEEQIKSEEIITLTQSLNKELKTKLDSILLDLRSSMNADFILTYGVQSSILSANDSLDITEKVLSQLNNK